MPHLNIPNNSLLIMYQGGTDDGGSSIEFKTGYNPNTSSGVFRVQTANAGHTGNSGEIILITGKATKGNSGSISFETGSTKTGVGGEINYTKTLLLICFTILSHHSHLTN